MKSTGEQKLCLCGRLALPTKRSTGYICARCLGIEERMERDFRKVTCGRPEIGLREHALKCAL